MPCSLYLRIPLPQLNMNSEIPICPLCHTPRMPRRKGDAGFWGCHNYAACAAPTTTTPPVPQNLNDRIPAKGCRHLLVNPWANSTEKGNTCQLCGAIINDKGEITRTSKSIQQKLVSKRGETTFQPEGGGTHRTGSGARRGRRSQEVAGRGPFGSTSSQEQSDRSSIRSGTDDGEHDPDQETVGSEPGASWSINEDRPEKTFAGRHQKHKDNVRKMVRSHQGGRKTTEQQGRHSTVHRFL